MRHGGRLAYAFAGALVTAGLTVAVSAAAGGKATTIRACASKSDGSLRLLSTGGRCRRSERTVTWAAQGPPGVPGRDGATGATGATGAAGAAGATNVVVRRGFGLVPDNSSASAIAVCNAGERAIGGGGQPLGSNATMTQSLPALGSGGADPVDGSVPNAWRAVWHANGSGFNVIAYVVCASP